MPPKTYGKQNEFTSHWRDLPEHEPAFILSARDMYAPAMLQVWASYVEPTAPDLAERARELAKQMIEWRRAHQ
jgi:hypothetical protein